MYRISSLDVGYGDKVVVRGLDFSLRPGRIYALIGSNGAGKSTILRTLAGLQDPLSGTRELHGRGLEHYSPRELAKILSVVLTEPIQLGMQTVFEVVLLGRLPFTGYFGALGDGDKRIAEDALERVGAIHLSTREFDSLSDGEKQKVMIARALAQQPEVMILDEPTSHLDIKHRIEIMRILKNLVQNQNVSVLMSLHDLDLAMKMADEVIILKEGAAVYSGIVEKVSRHIDLSDVYDLVSSSYHEELGAIEIKNENPARVLVVGGGKSAVSLMRMLSKMGVGAVLYGASEGELDFEIASVMGLRTMKPGEEAEVSALMGGFEVVVVANEERFKGLKIRGDVGIISYSAGVAEEVYNEINRTVRRLR